MNNEHAAGRQGGRPNPIGSGVIPAGEVGSFSGQSPPAGVSAAFYRTRAEQVCPVQRRFAIGLLLSRVCLGRRGGLHRPCVAATRVGFPFLQRPEGHEIDHIAMGIA